MHFRGETTENVATSRTRTPGLLNEYTEVENVEEIEEIEIIFAPCTDLNNCGLYACRCLRSLVLIDTNLQSICSSALSSVSGTLEHLNLSQQKLGSMKGLVLPRLKELLLHENKISTIEGLEGCPRLQRLWLNCNVIKNIEGLHAVGDLREVWLQNNLIVRVEGMDSLSHLREICLAGNKIDCFKDCNLNCLSTLPSIRIISFNDIYYGPNPVVEHSGYRDFIIRQLKHVKCVDGVQISEAEKEKVEDSYARGVAEFNESIERIHMEAEQEMAIIREQRKKIKLDGRKIEDQLLTHVVDLENLIKTSLKQAEDTIQKHISTRDTNRLTFEKKLSTIVDLFTFDIDNLIQEQVQHAEREDQAFCLVEAIAKAKYEQDLIILQSEQENSHKIKYQALKEDTVDYQFIQSLFSDNQFILDKKRRTELAMLQCYRIMLGSNIESKNTDAENISTDNAVVKPYLIFEDHNEYMYCCISKKDVILFQNPELIISEKQKVMLFSDPLLAAEYHEENQKDRQEVGEFECDVHSEIDTMHSRDSHLSSDGSSQRASKRESDSADETSSQVTEEYDDAASTALNYYIMVQCTINSQQGKRVSFDERPSFPRISESIQNYYKESDDILLLYPEKRRGDTIGRQGRILCTERSNNRIHPQYHILACRVGNADSELNTEIQQRSAEEIIQTLETDSMLSWHDETGAEIGRDCMQQLRDEFCVYTEAAKQCIDMDQNRNECDVKEEAERVEDASIARRGGVRLERVREKGKKPFPDKESPYNSAAVQNRSADLKQSFSQRRRLPPGRKKGLYE